MHRSLRPFLTAAALAFCLLASACPGKPQKASGSLPSSPGQPLPRVSLLCTDLGLADGAYVREADSALSALAENGVITYTRIGELPPALTVEARSGDVGLPHMQAQTAAGEKLTLEERDPGSMSLTEAIALLNEGRDCDVLVVSSAMLVSSAIAHWETDKLPFKALILLDQDYWPDRKLCAVRELPIFTFSYDVAPVAFLAGVAASASSNNASFIAIGSKDDPQSTLWLDAAYAGAKWQSNGTSMMTTRVPSGPEGLVLPQDYKDAMARLRKIAGPNFACNHYLVCTGRSTASIAYALSSAPSSGYIAAGWADYRQVRPARFVGCALKHPGAALSWLFGPGAQSTGGRQFHALLAPGAPPSEGASIVELPVGLAEGAVGFSEFNLYKQFNPDGDDIEKAVLDAQSQIEAGELDVHSIMEKYRRLSEEELSR